MDSRFPNYIRWIVRKLDFLGLPNLGTFICAITVLGFVGQTFLNVPLENFVFNPHAFFAGEWWRIFSFPVSRFSSPFWFLFYVIYIYIIMDAIEGAWGPGPLTVFTLFCYVAGLVAAFFVGGPIDIWYYVISNISLAFGTLFPDMEFLFMFIIPVKAKWFAMLAGAMILLQFIAGAPMTKAELFIVHLPYLLFFGPMFWSKARTKYRVMQNRRRLKD